MTALELTPEQQALTDRFATLAQSRFAPRAAHYDRTATFPSEDFDDLFAAGLNAPTVPRERGGLGLGPHLGDALTLWRITTELAKADLSLARCWEGHANSLAILDGMGTDEQRDRWFEGVVRRGDKWVAWSGEPQARAPGERAPYGTTVTKVDGGYVVDGTKVFATSATAAQWAILLVSLDGPGGIRHATGSPESQRAAGVRSVRSQRDHRRVVVGPDRDAGHREPSGALPPDVHPRRQRDRLPRAVHQGSLADVLRPALRGDFVGAAEAAYAIALAFATARQAADPYVQHHIASMSINIETAHLWLRHVARLWETGRRDEAQLAGCRARHVIEHLAEDALKHCIRACGARSLNRPGDLERIYRDLSFYVRHDNDDHILATIGRALLGQSHDRSFYVP